MALNLDTLGLSATVNAQGISAPDYQTILSTITGYFQQIYGTDAYIDPDSKDGQMISLLALAIHDANNSAIQVYNSFSPSTAMSDALSRNVKINGIGRNGETRSVVDLLCIGTTGQTITNGSVRDANNIIWNLPASVTIQPGGQVIATATCATPGAVAAMPGTINQISTPTRGWTSVTNPSAATVGTAVEQDSALRIRQSQSVALPSITPFAALDGAISNVPGVTRHKLYENDTGSADANGLPAHSVAAIVDGGDVTAVAQIICGKKGQGVSTFGSTSVVVPDYWGNPHTIYFSRPSPVPVYVAITLKVFTGYTTQVGNDIKTAVAAYINALSIGDDVLLSRVYSPANLGVMSGGESRYYDINSLQIGRSAAGVAAANIVTAYNEAVTCSVDNIAITVAS
ncbi:baseplate J/gp47 family protein [Pantoea ananatis]|uniref:baseplate J/gp47 family protein n=1 Tax=Pantoea ananas TaxID=553 RepID=UPI0004963863|nr:baseplate J/gp47 family protein [Pantoea ananatis]